MREVWKDTAVEENNLAKSVSPCGRSSENGRRRQLHRDRPRARVQVRRGRQGQRWNRPAERSRPRKPIRQALMRVPP